MATITLPYTITNGQTTDATKLMADLNAIVTEVNGNLESVNIKDLAVITDKLAALAVTAAKLATDAVETLKIKDANVTAVKLATDAVETLKIKDLNVTTGKLAADAITNEKIADDAVQAENVLGLTGTGTVSLDNVPDGTTYGKVKNSALTSGEHKTDSLVDGTYQKVHGDYVDANGKIDSIKEVNGARLLCKIIEIGDWNMDTTPYISVTHGLADFKKARVIDAILRNDGDTGYMKIERFIDDTDPDMLSAGINGINSTAVYLYRRTGGVFDTDLYDSTSYNRGWITIWYVE